MGRRLLDNLEQRVEGLPREPMNLVDDDDLVGVSGGAVAKTLGELADLFHFGIGGGVDLDDIEVRPSSDLVTRDTVGAGGVE